MKLSSFNSGDKPLRPAVLPLSMRPGEPTGNSFFRHDVEFPSPSDTPRFSGPVPILKPLPPPRPAGARPQLGKLYIDPEMGGVPLFQHVAGPHRIDDVMDESSTISPEERTIRPQDADHPEGQVPEYSIPQVMNADLKTGEKSNSLDYRLTNGNRFSAKIFIAPPKRGSLPTSTQTSSDVKTKEFSDENVEELDRLGEGAGGAVHKVRDKRDGEVYARKTIMTREVAMKQVFRELNVLQNMVHPNIVPYFGGYVSPSSSEVKIIMEYCDGGSLEAVMKKIKEIGGVVGEKITGRLAEGVSLC
jgi:mitogen-activated protein kinase kinase